MDRGMPHSQSVQSLERGLDLLESVVDRPGLALGDLAAGAQLKTTTAFNLARTLVERGYLCKSGGRPVGYTVGPALIDLGSRLPREDPLVATLRELAAGFPDWRFVVGQADGPEIRCRWRTVPGDPARVERPERMSLAPYTTASSLCHEALWSGDRATQFAQTYPFDLYGVGFWGTEERYRIALDQFSREGRVVVAHSRLPRVACPVRGTGGELRMTIGASYAGASPESLPDCFSVVEAIANQCNNIIS